VQHRRPFQRPLVVTGLTLGGLVAVVGGLALRGPGLVAVAVAGGLAACLGWGTARESTGPVHRSNTEAAVLAAAWTIGVLLVLSGTSVLAGGVVAAALASAAAVAALAVWIVRTPREQFPTSAVAGSGPTAHGNVPGPLAPLRPAVLRGSSSARPWELPPVSALPTEELGREWLESTSALAGRLEPATRSAIVRRRQDALDELERRDPEGFLRWLAAGPALGRDPSAYVRGRTAGESAAGTDAA
jgi:hypothetical protein